MSQLDQADSKRHKNVRAWFKMVPDNALHVSAITIMEAWRGFEKARKKAEVSPKELTVCTAFELAFEELMMTFQGRVIPIGEQIAKLWGQLRGRQDKNHWDQGVAAAAIVHEMVVATRNVADFEGLGVRVVNPFQRRPTIRGPTANFGRQL